MPCSKQFLRHSVLLRLSLPSVTHLRGRLLLLAGERELLRLLTCVRVGILFPILVTRVLWLLALTAQTACFSAVQYYHAEERRKFLLLLESALLLACSNEFLRLFSYSICLYTVASRAYLSCSKSLKSYQLYAPLKYHASDSYNL